MVRKLVRVLVVLPCARGRSNRRERFAARAEYRRSCRASHRPTQRRCPRSRCWISVRWRAGPPPAPAAAALREVPSCIAVSTQALTMAIACGYAMPISSLAEQSNLLHGVTRSPASKKSRKVMERRVGVAAAQRLHQRRRTCRTSRRRPCRSASRCAVRPVRRLHLSAKVRRL